MFYFSAEMCNFMLFKALWTSLPGVDFFSPAQFFSLFSSHALSWQQLHSKLILCFVGILVWGARIHTAHKMICSRTFHTPTYISSDDIQGLRKSTNIFLLDLIRLHFTWENCDDIYLALAVFHLSFLSSCSLDSIFIQLQCLPLDFLLTPTHLLTH